MDRQGTRADGVVILQRHEPSPYQPEIAPGLYVFADMDRPTHSVRHALAGPFASAVEARLWVLQRLEAELSESHRETWGKLTRRLAGVTHDLGVELFLLEWVAKGKSYEKLCKYAPKIPPRHSVDRRAAAANDRETA